MRGALDGTGPIEPQLPAPYRLHQALGTGAMGSVFAADDDLGRRVAIKVMHDSLRGDRAMLAQFQQEALAASRINHPHAVAVLDTGLSLDGLPFIVMECLRGRSLAAIVAERSLPPARAIAIGAQILSALDEAHGCGVIHGDLKSDNVVVEALGDGSDFAKVLDFGLARVDGGLERAGMVAGTPEYMAPELIGGSPPTRRTDLYAMGALLFEMIVGRTPFAGGDIPAVLDRQLHEDPPKLEVVAPTCPPALAAVIARALAKAPRRRYDGAAAMRAELLVAAGGALARCAVCREESAPDARFCARCGVGTTRASARDLPARARADGSRDTLVPPPVRDLGSVPGARSSRTSRLSRYAEQAIVGREEELKDVVAFLRGGTAHAALTLVGPPGIGKTAIALAAARRIAPERTTFVTSADPTDLARSWYPILVVLESVLGLKARTLPELGAAIARCGLPARDLPGLAELFGLDGPLAALELAVRRREAHHAARRVLVRACDWFPGCALGFFDVDRYDRPSQALLATLVEGSDPSGPRILCTARWAATLPPEVLFIEIEGLPPDEAHQLAHSLLGAHPHLPAAAELHRLTGGSPSWIEHVAGWIDEGHDLARAPDAQRDLIAARLSHLPSAMRLVLQAVAVLGQVVPRKLVPELVDGRGPTTAAIASLVRAGLVVLVGDDLVIPSMLVRDAVIGTTPASVRHTLASRALALTPAADAAMAGHLAAQIGDHPTAAAQFLSAAAAAVHGFDDDGAIRWLLRARDSALACDPAATESLVEIAIRTVDVGRFTGDDSLAQVLLDEAEQLEPIPAQRAPLHQARARLALAAGQDAEAIQAFRAAIGQAVRVGNPRVLCAATLELCAVLTRLDRQPEAAAELLGAIELVTLGEGPAAETGPPEVWRLALRLAELRLRLADLGGARDIAAAALQRATARADGQAVGRLHAILAEIADAGRDPVAATDHVTRAIDQLRALGDRRSTAELLLERARQAWRRAPSTGSAAWSGPRAAELARQLASEIGWTEGVLEAQLLTA